MTTVMSGGISWESFERLRPLLRVAAHDRVLQVPGEDVLLLRPPRHVGLRGLDHGPELLRRGERSRCLSRSAGHPSRAHREEQSGHDRPGCPRASTCATSLSTNVRTRPAMNSKAPRVCHDARNVSGRFRNHPRLTASAIRVALHLGQPLGERPFRLESAGPAPRP